MEPTVLFVCVSNAGKSQMAAALLRDISHGRVHVVSAGTQPGEHLNGESVASLGAIGVSVEGEYNKPVTEEMLRAADRVIMVGPNAQLPELTGVQVERWLPDEPSERGIQGRERMDLLRDDLAERARVLFAELEPDLPPVPEPPAEPERMDPEDEEF